ncbi:BrnT family toxin [Bauldia litoralis]|uniref:BrnT family toxin n=1 Tax=Bauldia litoralis TaxID=665467 RepID=UPI0032669BA8
MEYEWDPKKAAANLAKHGVAFERVAQFEWNEAEIEEDDRSPYGERRFYALGMIDGRIHALIFTMRGEAVRVISLRKANDRERRRYEQG